MMRRKQNNMNKSVLNTILLITIFLSFSTQSTAFSFWHSDDIDDSNGHLYFQNSSIVRTKRQEACEFRCDSGECIGLEFLCDGNSDCADGSDETKTQCGKVRCPSFLFQCKYGACIAKNLVCNGQKNCADNSDEEAPECGDRRPQGTCSNFEFQCDNGQCIDKVDTCDGVKTCADGSDETENACTGLVCADFLYRCDYGACVIKKARCNGVNDCADGSDEAGCPSVGPTPTPTPTPVTPSVTPSVGCFLPALPNGKYKIVAEGRFVESGYIQSNTVISFSCDDGYTPSNENKVFYCVKTKWIPSLDKEYCARTCPPLLSTDTFETQCTLDHQLVSCEKPVEGTLAYITCKPYYKFYGNRQIPVCRDGAWDPYAAPCQPECGQKIVNAQTLIVGGSDAIEGEYPWLVGIYNTSNGQSRHICGGTIISRFYVLSAAHCFTNSKGNPQDSDFFTIVAGKYYRQLNILEETAQSKQIKRLYIHDDYKGNLQKFRDDIALIEVEPFEMTSKVQLICMDWENRYEEQDFQEDNKAVVAGWGYTKEGSTPAEVLKKLVVPYRSTETCRRNMDPDFFEQFHSSDKICAGFLGEGSGVCSGDSGGGLYFRSLQTTFFIRGIVSLAPQSQTGCNTNHYALYTKVSRYLDWIQKITLKRI